MEAFYWNLFHFQQQLAEISCSFVLRVCSFIEDTRSANTKRLRAHFHILIQQADDLSELVFADSFLQLWCVYGGRLLNNLHKIQRQWCSQGQRLFISGWSPDRTWCQMQTSLWLTAFCAIGKSLMFGWEDRTAAKWMLGALPGIKLMNPAAASGHRDTNTAWVVTCAQCGVFGLDKKKKTGEKSETTKP